jgi:hypothetical protein
MVGSAAHYYSSEHRTYREPDVSERAAQVAQRVNGSLPVVNHLRRCRGVPSLGHTGGRRVGLPLAVIHGVDADDRRAGRLGVQPAQP